MNPSEGMLKRKLLDKNPTPSPSLLLRYMGLCNERQDPTIAIADWPMVLEHLNTHPHEARSMFGLSFPLNLALCNRINPVPAAVVDDLIYHYPDALMEEDIGNACRNSSTLGETMHVLIAWSKQLLKGREILKRWDLDWIACHNNLEVAKAVIQNLSDEDISNVLDWKKIRSCNTTFWLSSLMEEGSHRMSKEFIQSERILHFYILNGHYSNVKLILVAYPDLLSATCTMGDKSKQLPIHIALSSDTPHQYRSWHNRSQILRLLLEYGIKFKVGGPFACGGLWTKDSHQDTLSYAIESALNYPFVDMERQRCLQVCLQYAQASMYNNAVDQVDFTLPLLHASIGVVSLVTFSAMIEKYGPSLLLEKDRNGSTVLFQLISIASERPRAGYIATRNVLELREKDFLKYHLGTVDMNFCLYYANLLRDREQRLFDIQPSLNNFYEKYFRFNDLHPLWVLFNLLNSGPRHAEYTLHAEYKEWIYEFMNQSLENDFNFQSAVAMYNEYMKIRDIKGAMNGPYASIPPNTQPRDFQLNGNLENNGDLVGEDDEIERDDNLLNFVLNHKEELRSEVRWIAEDLDRREEHIIEKTYFTCLCNILLMKEHSADGTIANIAEIKNGKGRYPLLTVVLRCTYLFEQVLTSFPGALSQLDMETCLLPFALVAAGPHGSLTLSFQLLLHQPNVLDQFI